MDASPAYENKLGSTEFGIPWIDARSRHIHRRGVVTERDFSVPRSFICSRSLDPPDAEDDVFVEIHAGEGLRLPPIPGDEIVPDDQALEPTFLSFAKPGEVSIFKYSQSCPAVNPHPCWLGQPASVCSTYGPRYGKSFALRVPQALVKNNLISDLQLEVVFHIVHQLDLYREKMFGPFLTGAQKATTTAPGLFEGPSVAPPHGFLLADGHQSGKKRIVATSIMHLWTLGHRRHLWISDSPSIVADLRREFTAIGASHVPIFDLFAPGHKKLTNWSIYASDFQDLIKHKVQQQQGLIYGGEGVCCISYTLLASQFKQFMESEFPKSCNSTVRIEDFLKSAGSNAVRNELEVDALHWWNPVVNCIRGLKVASRFSQMLQWLTSPGGLCFEQSVEGRFVNTDAYEQSLLQTENLLPLWQKDPQYILPGGLLVVEDWNKCRNIEDDAASGHNGRNACTLLQALAVHCPVLYVSSSGLESISELGYLPRLGEWGPDLQSFKEYKEKLLNNTVLSPVENAMVSLTAQGKYSGRFVGFTNSQLTILKVKPGEKARELIDEVSRCACQVFELLCSLEPSTPTVANLVKRAKSSYWIQTKKLFQLLSACDKVPHAAALAKSLVKKGEQVVISVQICLDKINGEKLKAPVSGASSSNGGLELWPIHQATRLIDIIPVQLRTPEIKKLCNQMRESLQKLDFPACPNELLLDELGRENVVEFAPRRRSGVQGSSEDSPTKYREAQTTLGEQFLSGSKLIALVSEAVPSVKLCADRISTHALRPRAMICLDTPAGNEVADQLFDLVHGGNDLYPPQFFFLTSELCGETFVTASAVQSLRRRGAYLNGLDDENSSKQRSDHDSPARAYVSSCFYVAKTFSPSRSSAFSAAEEASTRMSIVPNPSKYLLLPCGGTGDASYGASILIQWLKQMSVRADPDEPLIDDSFTKTWGGFFACELWSQLQRLGLEEARRAPAISDDIFNLLISRLMCVEFRLHSHGFLCLENLMEQRPYWPTQVESLPVPSNSVLGLIQPAAPLEVGKRSLHTDPSTKAILFLRQFSIDRAVSWSTCLKLFSMTKKFSDEGFYRSATGKHIFLVLAVRNLRAAIRAQWAQTVRAECVTSWQEFSALNPLRASETTFGNVGNEPVVLICPATGIHGEDLTLRISNIKALGFKCEDLKATFREVLECWNRIYSDSENASYNLPLQIQAMMVANDLTRRRTVSLICGSFLQEIPDLDAIERLRSGSNGTRHRRVYVADDRTFLGREIDERIVPYILHRLRHLEVPALSQVQLGGLEKLISHSYLAQRSIEYFIQVLLDKVDVALFVLPIMEACFSIITAVASEYEKLGDSSKKFLENFRKVPIEKFTYASSKLAEEYLLNQVLFPLGFKAVLSEVQEKTLDVPCLSESASNSDLKSSFGIFICFWHHLICSRTPEKACQLIQGIFQLFQHCSDAQQEPGFLVVQSAKYARIACAGAPRTEWMNKIRERCRIGPLGFPGVETTEGADNAPSIRSIHPSTPKALSAEKVPRRKPIPVEKEQELKTTVKVEIPFPVKASEGHAPTQSSNSQDVDGDDVPLAYLSAELTASSSSCEKIVQAQPPQASPPHPSVKPIGKETLVSAVERHPPPAKEPAQLPPPLPSIRGSVAPPASEKVEQRSRVTVDEIKEKRRSPLHRPSSYGDIISRGPLDNERELDRRRESTRHSDRVAAFLGKKRDAVERSDDNVKRFKSSGSYEDGEVLSSDGSEQVSRGHVAPCSDVTNRAPPRKEANSASAVKSAVHPTSAPASTLGGKSASRVVSDPVGPSMQRDPRSSKTDSAVTGTISSSGPKAAPPKDPESSHVSLPKMDIPGSWTAYIDAKAVLDSKAVKSSEVPPVGDPEKSGGESDRSEKLRKRRRLIYMNIIYGNPWDPESDKELPRLAPFFDDATAPNIMALIDNDEGDRRFARAAPAGDLQAWATLDATTPATTTSTSSSVSSAAVPEPAHRVRRRSALLIRKEKGPYSISFDADPKGLEKSPVATTPLILPSVSLSDSSPPRLGVVVQPADTSPPASRGSPRITQLLPPSDRRTDESPGSRILTETVSEPARTADAVSLSDGVRTQSQSNLLFSGRLRTTKPPPRKVIMEPPKVLQRRNLYWDTERFDQFFAGDPRAFCILAPEINRGLGPRRTKAPSSRVVSMQGLAGEDLSARRITLAPKEDSDSDAPLVRLPNAR